MWDGMEPSGDGAYLEHVDNWRWLLPVTLSLLPVWLQDGSCCLLPCHRGAPSVLTPSHRASVLRNHSSDPFPPVASVTFVLSSDESSD